MLRGFHLLNLQPRRTRASGTGEEGVRRRGEQRTGRSDKKQCQQIEHKRINQSGPSKFPGLGIWHDELWRRTNKSSGKVFSIDVLLSQSNNFTSQWPQNLDAGSTLGPLSRFFSDGIWSLDHHMTSVGTIGKWTWFRDEAVRVERRRPDIVTWSRNWCGLPSHPHADQRDGGPKFLGRIPAALLAIGIHA